MTRSIGAVPDANGEACVDGAVVEEEGHSIFQGILILICILHVIFISYSSFFKSITMIDNREWNTLYMHTHPVLCNKIIINSQCHPRINKYNVKI